MKIGVWFKVILFAFFGFLYWLATPYPQQSRQFPQLIALFSLVLIAVSLVMDFTTRRTARAEIAEGGDTEVTMVDPTVKQERKTRVARAGGIILVSTAAGFLGGFLVSTFLFFVGFAFFFGKRETFWANTAVAVGVTGVIYVLFQRIMGVPLLGSVLW